MTGENIVQLRIIMKQIPLYCKHTCSADVTSAAIKIALLPISCATAAPGNEKDNRAV